MYLQNQKGGSNVLMIIIIGLLVILIGGLGYFLYTESKNTEGKNTNTVATTENINTGTSNANGDVITDRQKIQLSNVYDGKGAGTAEKKNVNGTYTLTIATTDLPKPADDHEYVAWIEKKVPYSNIKAGVLEKESDGVYTLEFTSGTDYGAYLFVYVTSELKNQTGGTMTGDTILSGRFTL